jgi:5-methylcytosine-specific restriction endonuclease McrA
MSASAPRDPGAHAMRRTVCIRCGTVADRSPCTACTPRGTGSTARGYTSAWQRTSARVIAEEHGICHLCGRPGADTTDHLQPKHLGGTDERANLRAAHRACNGRKGANDG